MKSLIVLRYLYLVFVLLCFGCLDEEIEGAATNSQPFKASKVTATVTALNNCTIQSGGLNGSTFSIKIDLQGQKLVNFVDGAYRFSSQSTSTAIPSFSFIQTGGSTGGSFRSKSSGSASNYITISQCVRFGTNTSITYDFSITSEDFETSTISLTIPKPVGSN